MNILKKSKNAKLIPWLDMKLVKKSKNVKLIPWLDMKLMKKIQKSKINSLTWYDFIEFDFFRSPIIHSNIDF